MLKSSKWGYFMLPKNGLKMKKIFFVFNHQNIGSKLLPKEEEK